jgi:flagellar hook-associated protein 2
MDLGISGLASGFDWRSFLDQMVEVERSPQARLRSDQDKINQRSNAYDSIKTELGVLSNRLLNLKEGVFFSKRTAQSSDALKAKVTAGTGAVLGQHTVNVIQLATAAAQRGLANAGAALSATNDLSGVTVADAPMAVGLKEGFFTVNGKQVTVASTDTLQDVLNRISTATSGAVSASYDSATDQIRLSGGAPIVLGSASDTSNFLTAAKLNNNGTGTITSTSALGAVRLAGSLANANLATAITDGGSGAGEFKINGVSIAFNASTDSVTDVINRINNSAAGVTASYDRVEDRLVLTNKVTGDIGVGFEDVTGNFLAATGLSGGTLQRGQDLLYTVDNGGQLSSHTNTITEESSGLTGVSITALAEGEVSVTVATDTETIKKAITDFIEAFNKVQSMIDTQTASTTDSKGKVSAGVLADDGEADEIASKLRSLANGYRSALTGAVKSLDDLGIVSNGNDNTIKLTDTAKLDKVLAENLTDVQALFTDAEDGIAVELDEYLERTIGDEGTLEQKQDLLGEQTKSIDEQIAAMERRVTEYRQRMIESFTAMEEAQARVNQQLQYLQKRFGGS